MVGAPPPPVTEEFLQALGHEDFRGPLWHGLSAVLAGYGMAVITSWIKDGNIFTKLAERGVRYELATAEHHYPRDDDAIALASETVARALDRLRILLRSRRWSADGPAQLHTYFMKQCLIQFPNVYKRWRGENVTGTGDDPSTVESMSKIPDDLRAVTQLRAEGVPLADIREQLGWRAESMANALARHRRRPLADEA